MSFNQFRSNFRTGEPKDHLQAKNIIKEYLEGIGCDVHKEYPLLADMYKPYQHDYDVVGFGKVIVVEVDDEDLHNKPKKQRNDKIAQERAEEKFPFTLSFIRLDKDDINLSWKQKDDTWFQDNLYKKI